MDEVKVLIDREIENLKDEIVNIILQFIKIRSVEDIFVFDMLFGKGINDVLFVCENFCKSLGFEIKNYDGYVFEVVYGN